MAKHKQPPRIAYTRIRYEALNEASDDGKQLVDVDVELECDWHPAGIEPEMFTFWLAKDTGLPPLVFDDDFDDIRSSLSDDGMARVTVSIVDDASAQRKMKRHFWCPRRFDVTIKPSS